MQMIIRDSIKMSAGHEPMMVDVRRENAYRDNVCTSMQQLQISQAEETVCPSNAEKAMATDDHAESAIFFIGGVGESRLEDDSSVSTFRFRLTSFDGDSGSNFIKSSGSGTVPRVGDRKESGVWERLLLDASVRNLVARLDLDVIASA